ncbi:MAG: DUF3857 domain-containing protein [Bacteroidales bacterium]|nr:DUF3857 domain-containing protein [Bacteroidales bacterium]
MKRSTLLALRLFICCLIFLRLFSVQAGGDENLYPASSIPASLCYHAGAVIRLSETDIEILSAKSIRKKYHIVITVMYEDALEKAAISLHYNDFQKVQKIRGCVYNKYGKEIDKIRSSDFSDRSAIPDGTFHSEERVKAFNPVYNGSYPVTIEYEYETVGEAPAHYPMWFPQNSLDLSVESASLTLTAPSEIFPRFRVLNDVDQEEINTEDGKTTMAWRLAGLPALHHEIYSPPLIERVSGVLFAPVFVDYKGFSEEFLTWRDIGEWYNYLLQGRDELPERTKTRIAEMTSGMTDTIAIIRAVYRYMQSAKRYVSIQLGIGGWQPFDATFVDTYGYGDCKALVNYTRALLKSVGILSYYSPVYAGARVPDIFTDFPSLQFNHIILYVPLAHDTIWLECTNPNIPFGFLGNYTDNRHALVVDPAGAFLARTPAYTSEMNRLQRKTTISLYTSGDAEVEMMTRYSGLQYELAEGIDRLGMEEQKKAFVAALKIPDIVVHSLSYSSDSSMIPTITERATFLARSFASVSGQRIFVPVNQVSRISPVTVNSEERQSSVFTGYPYADTDSIVVRWPSGFCAESLPSDVSIESPFGSYKTTIHCDSIGFTLVRIYKQSEVRFSVEDYPEFRDFINQVAKIDKQKGILRKTLP